MLRLPEVSSQLLGILEIRLALPTLIDLLLPVHIATMLAQTGRRLAARTAKVARERFEVFVEARVDRVLALLTECEGALVALDGSSFGVSVDDVRLEVFRSLEGGRAVGAFEGSWLSRAVKLLLVLVEGCGGFEAQLTAVANELTGVELRVGRIVPSAIEFLAAREAGGLEVQRCIVV